MGSNREKSNNAIAILEKFTIWTYLIISHFNVNKESINIFNASSDNINKVLLVPLKYKLSLFQLCESKSCCS